MPGSTLKDFLASTDRLNTCSDVGYMQYLSAHYRYNAIFWLCYPRVCQMEQDQSARARKLLLNQQSTINTTPEGSRSLEEEK